tara:strand:+ start:658 stop:1236 length:579 start_codon:yes stop_codon:yes gene_type:complete
MKTIYHNKDTGAILKIAQMKYLNHPSFEYSETNWKEDLIEALEESKWKYEFGRNVLSYGEIGTDYIYTNKHHLAKAHTFFTKYLTDCVRKYIRNGDRDKVYNHLLINQYLPNMSLNRHKDDEPELQGTIASLTLGDSALFTYGNPKSKYNIITLKEDDLLIGNKEFFTTMYHQVSEPLNQGTRYNFTWRTII